MSLSQKLRDRGLEWTPLPQHHPDHPIANAAIDYDKIRTAGQVPFKDGEIITGKVGDDVSLEDAVEAAKICALQLLYAAGSVVDDADDIVGLHSLTVYVNVAPGFDQLSQVANGASEFFKTVLSPDGVGTREAIGVAQLPGGAAIEMVAVFTIR